MSLVTSVEFRAQLLVLDIIFYIRYYIVCNFNLYSVKFTQVHCII